jgi:hypothetical protein
VSGTGHAARWSSRQPSTLVITDASGDAVTSFPVVPPGDRPTVRLLWGTGWSHYPGAEWQEADLPGQWRIGVFHGHSVRQATTPGPQTATGRRSAPPGSG